MKPPNPTAPNEISQMGIICATGHLSIPRIPMINAAIEGADRISKTIEAITVLCIEFKWFFTLIRTAVGLRSPDDIMDFCCGKIL